MSLVRRIARPLLASIFITEGIDTLRHPETRVVQAAPAVEKVSQPLGVTINAKTAVRVNGAVMVVGGRFLPPGKLRGDAATPLTSSRLPRPFVGHPFWRNKTPNKRAPNSKAF